MPIKKFLLLCAFLFPATLISQTAPISGYCVQGAEQSLTSGSKSSNFLQGIVPSCIVTIYYTGTTTQVPGNLIFKDNIGTVLGNPFTANTNGSWLFYAATTQGYDIVLSGGIPPNTYQISNTLTNVFTSGVGSVSNLDGTLTFSPSVGAVVGSLNLGHANTWTATQTFGNITVTGIAGSATYCVQVSSTGVLSNTGAACGTGSGGGSVSVNGSTVSSPNFNGVTPAAQASYINTLWQFSGSNVSTEVPYASSSQLGMVQGDGATLSITSGVASVVEIPVTSASGNFSYDIPMISPATGNVSVYSSSGFRLYPPLGSGGAVLELGIAGSNQGSIDLYSAYGGSIFIAAPLTANNYTATFSAGSGTIPLTNYANNWSATNSFQAVNINGTATITSIEGASTYCVQVSAAGVLSNTGASCGGSQVQVATNILTTANFNNTTPSAQANYQNVSWQYSGSSVSAEVPYTSSSVFGVAEVDNATIVASTGQISVSEVPITSDSSSSPRTILLASAAFGNRTVLSNGYLTFTPSTQTLSIGQAGSISGNIQIINSSAGSITLSTPSGLGSPYTATFPANTGTLTEINLAETWSALQTFGTNISIGGVTATGATGTGNVAFSASPTFTGTITGANLTLTGTPTFSGIEGSGTYCVQISSAGVLSNTGSACGGFGGVGSVSNSDGTLTISPTTGSVVASLALGNANTWTGLQTFGTHISIGGVTAAGATGTGNVVFSASPTFTGTITAANLTLSGTPTFTGIEGSGTYCVQISSAGVLSNTGASCGTGSGTVNSVSNSDGTLTFSPTTGAVVGSLALGHANTWTGLQTFGTEISIGGVTAAGATGTSNVVFSNSPTLSNPALGTPASGVITNLTGTCANCTANAVVSTLTFNNLGSGAVSGTGYNGSAAYIISYNTIGAASSGANSNITSLSGLTTPLTVPQGGTGVGTLTGIVYGNGTSPFTAATASQVNNLIENLSGCSTGGNFYSPGSGLCSAQASQVYPGAGIANSTGSSWGTSYSSGNQIPVSDIAVANLTFSNSGSGGASGTTYNTSAAQTISYNSVGAPSVTGSGASGTWGINISGNAATATTANSVVNGLTMNNSGSGAASGTIFTGANPYTISYNTIGAPSVTGANASGTWGINISGIAAEATDGYITSGLPSGPTTFYVPVGSSGGYSQFATDNLFTYTTANGGTVNATNFSGSGSSLNNIWHQVSFLVGADNGPALDTTYSQNSIWSDQFPTTYNSNMSVVFSYVWCQTNTGSASINITNNNSSNMISSNLTCTTSGANTSFSSTVSNGNPIGLTVASIVSGSPTRITVTLRYQ